MSAELAESTLSPAADKLIIAGAKDFDESDYRVHAVENTIGVMTGAEIKTVMGQLEAEVLRLQTLLDVINQTRTRVRKVLSA